MYVTYLAAEEETWYALSNYYRRLAAHEGVRV